MATLSGKRIVDMVWEDLRIRDIVDARAIDNAVTTVLALGGSTNALVHLIAIARRAGVALDLDALRRARAPDAGARQHPALGQVPDGGLLLRRRPARPAVAARPTCSTADARTVNGRTLGENIAGADVYNDDVIRPRDNPLVANDGLAVLRGNLAPDGAVIKPAAMEAHLQRHTGPAVVFATTTTWPRASTIRRSPSPPDSVLVLQSAGPQGAPGLPEWGQLPIPKKLLQQGVRDMVRISDARMSGTSYGACVLHVAPESHVGGPLALVRDGDLIELDVPAGS